MKKFAITIAALSLSAGVAFAENPYVSNPNVVQSGPQAGQSTLDRGTTASVWQDRRIVVKQSEAGYQNPAGDRFGDAAPRY